MKDFEIFTTASKTAGVVGFWIYPLKNQGRGLFYDFNPDTNKILNVTRAQAYNVTKKRFIEISINELPKQIIEHYSDGNPDLLKLRLPFARAIKFDYGGYKVT